MIQEIENRNGLIVLVLSRRFKRKLSHLPAVYLNKPHYTKRPQALNTTSIIPTTTSHIQIKRKRKVSDPTALSLSALLTDFLKHQTQQWITLETMTSHAISAKHINAFAEILQRS
jgi:hypothetical protein